MPEETISENGTNFVGAKQELQELTNKFCQNSRLKESSIGLLHEEVESLK